MRWLMQFLHDDDGTTAVEYAVMLAMILLVAIASISTFGGTSGGMWGGIESNLSSTPFGS